ncbi:UNVERIFIED_CONTAM: hypothetical protein FKN15_038050 [Acipenser sinensis]
MTEILFQYADRSLKKCPEHGKIQVIEQHFQDMVPIIVDYCLLLQRTDLLFNQIYSKLGENSVVKGVFLECLEPYILSDRLTGLTPVVQMCWEHHLHDAMIYVYNSGMNDYINPMEVFEFLVRLHSVEAASDEEVYPYIRTLLHFDTREFLNMLALVIVENWDFTPTQVGCLFTFLARQLAKPDNTLFVNRTLFDQVLEFLCSPDDDSRHTERQNYQICEFMYEKKHLYDKIIHSYLKDPLRKVFNCIHNILSIPGYSPEEKQSLWDEAMEHLKVQFTGENRQRL